MQLDAMHQRLAAYVDRGEVPGYVALVARGDEIQVDAMGKAARGGEVPVRRETIFRAASMTKPVTAAATMILVDDGVRPAGTQGVVAIDPISKAGYGVSMMTEIVPGITVDPERVFGKPVIAGTRVTAAQVLSWLAAGLSEVDIQAEHGLTPEQIRAALRYAAVLAEQNLDATFAALWADAERNAAEAERDRRTDAAIDAGAGFRGSIDDLITAVDG